MKQILSFIGSMKTMVVLMLIFAFSIGYATIVENDFGTMTAKAEIYNARWFEVLLGILALNLILNIFRYKMYTLKKAPIFIFHIGFLVILFGAAVTRYVGYEGTMHIREGMSASSIVSSNTFILVNTSYNGQKSDFSKVVYMSKRGGNSFDASFKMKDKKIDVKLLKYIPNAVEKLVNDSKNGIPMAKFMVTSRGSGKPVVIEQGKYFDAGKFILDFDSGVTFNKPVIKIFMNGDTLYMNHASKLSYFKMADRSKGELKASDKEVLNKRVLYSTVYGSNFVL